MQIFVVSNYTFCSSTNNLSISLRGKYITTLIIRLEFYLVLYSKAARAILLVLGCVDLQA